MNIAVKIENVNKIFGSTKVLDQVNMEFEQGKIHGLVGRNGSGKTMLMKCICGLVPLSSGKIIVNKTVLDKDHIQIPSNLGVIIENPGFLPSYNAYKNLKFLADINGKISKEQIYKAIRKVGLDPEDKKKVGKYSLGMRQRLGLAQAIMENPDLLILDEPMNGLDKEGVEDMRSYLLDLKKQGKTILLASHFFEDVERLCDTVSEMDKGKLHRIR